MDLTVVGFYRFAPIDNVAAIRDALERLANLLEVRGTILLAEEGINGTLAGQSEAIGQMVEQLRRIPGCEQMPVRTSNASDWPFKRLKVKIRREIVTLRQEADAHRSTGDYVPADEWDRIVADPDVILIDTRNDYETAIGTFKGAIDPGLTSFAQFPDWWSAHAEQFVGKRVAMFCTGGIRCEKASSYLKSKGIDDVVQLRGGILAYLADKAETDSSWQGECFVFDERVALTHGLKTGSYRMCRPCGKPVANSADICPHCTVEMST